MNTSSAKVNIFDFLGGGGGIVAGVALAAALAVAGVLFTGVPITLAVPTQAAEPPCLLTKPTR